MSISTPEDLADDLAACEAATEGPWKSKKSIHGNEYRYVQIGKDDSYTTLELEPQDANEIARQRTRFPAVVRELIEAREEIERLRERIAGLERKDGDE